MNLKQNNIIFSNKKLQDYLSIVFKKPVKVVRITHIGQPSEKEKEVDLKGFGYGIPYLIVAKMDGGEKKLVLETMKPGGFGHDHFSDRAGILLWQHSSFNKLMKHVRSVDVGAVTKDLNLKSIGDSEEFFILTEFVQGESYHRDLEKIKKSASLKPLDLDRCKALSDYLVEIHKLKKPDSGLYIRRIRDLLGHGEGIMGLLDSYPLNLDYIEQRDLTNIEKKCVEWRWKLKNYTNRLTQVHGDYHPWNILFEEGINFTVLDRSRGEWGEPADDISSMTINYIFYSIQTYGKMTETFLKLFNLFWKNYIDKTHDENLTKVIQPFFAWRGLVVASPIWYPDLPKQVRIKLLNFIFNVLETEQFDPTQINSYLKQNK